MPEPKEGEKRADFVERCIPIVLKDGSAEDQDQAVAMCNSMWRQAQEKSLGMEGETMISFGEPIKAIAIANNRLKVGSHGIRYGSPEERDLVHDWFASDTDYGPHKGDGMDTTFNHRIPVHAELQALSKQTFAPAKATPDELGIFVEAVLDLSDQYQAVIARLAEAGKLRWSSGTAAHMVDRDNETGKLLRWPIIEWAYAPAAAEPRLPPIAPIKALSDDITYPDLQAEAKAGSGRESAPDATGGMVTVNIYSSGSTTVTDPSVDEIAVSVSNNQTPEEGATSTEVLEMSDEQTENVEPQAESEFVDVAGIAQATAVEAAKLAAEEAIKAYQAQLEAEPPVKSGGVLITEDRADRELKAHPYKSCGEFLMSVAQAGSPHDPNIDERLFPLRSKDPGDENGFSLGKALGDGFVGSITSSHLKQTGLSETVPADGGFLVGTDRSPGLLARVYDVGQLIQRVDMTGISAGSNSMTFNAEDETSRADGSRRGGIRAYWAAEAAEKTASQPKFRQMELKLRKVVGLTYCTDELLADASALESWIMSNLPEELLFVVEDAIINGTGAGQPQGILNSAALVTVPKEGGQAATTIVAENVMKMWARRYIRGQDYIWLVNQDCGPQLWQMQLPVGTGGLPLYTPPGGLSDEPYARLMGRPLVESEYMQTVGTVGDIMLVSLKEYQMIEKGGIEAASSIHVRFIYDESVFRFVWRVDGESKWSSDLTPKNGTNTVSPFVALATRA